MGLQCHRKSFESLLCASNATAAARNTSRGACSGSAGFVSDVRMEVSLRSASVRRAKRIPPFSGKNHRRQMEPHSTSDRPQSPRLRRLLQNQNPLAREPSVIATSGLVVLLGGCPSSLCVALAVNRAHRSDKDYFHDPLFPSLFFA